MSDDDSPPGGSYYIQAIWALAPRNLRKTYAKIYNLRYGRKPPEEFEFPTVSPPSNLLGEFDAWKPIMEGFRRRRNAGEIIGFGHPDTAAAPQQEIPLDEWRWLRDDNHPHHSTFSGAGRIWYRVKFYTRQAVETWRRARRAADDDKGALETREPDANEAAAQDASDRKLGRKPGQYLGSLPLEEYIRDLAGDQKINLSETNPTQVARELQEKYSTLQGWHLKTVANRVGPILEEMRKAPVRY